MMSWWSFSRWILLRYRFGVPQLLKPLVAAQPVHMKVQSFHVAQGRARSPVLASLKMPAVTRSKMKKPRSSYFSIYLTKTFRQGKVCILSIKKILRMDKFSFIYNNLGNVFISCALSLHSQPLKKWRRKCKTTKDH